MILMVAIDPGEVHCGMASFIDDECIAAWELGPDECQDWIKDRLVNGGINELVVEKFQLYPWKAKEQAFSQMKTCEVIGALRFIHRTWGDGCAWFEQPATIKIPTRKIINAKGVKSKSGSIHAHDAQLHGWHRVFRRQQQTNN